MYTNIRIEGWYEKCYIGNKMKDSRFKLTIKCTESPKVIVPIKMHVLNPAFESATHKFLAPDYTTIKTGPPPKNFLSPPEIHSPETIGK